MSNLSNINGFLVNKNLNLWDLSRELLALEKIERKGKSMSEDDKEKR